MKRIDSIMIQNVRGISSKTFHTQIFANCPNILVAPNGFGKSSLCKAFSGLRTKDLKLDDSDLFEKKPTNRPILEIEIVENDNSTATLHADDSSNTISPRFDIFTISGKLMPKARLLKIPGSAPVSVPSLHISEITILDKVEKFILEHKHADEKSKFGDNGKAVFNITSALKNHSLFVEIYDTIDFSRFELVSSVKLIESLITKFSSIHGTSQRICAEFDSEVESSKIFPELNKLIELLLHYGCGTNRSEAFTAAIQILNHRAANSRDFTKFVKYCRYETKKQEVKELFSKIKKTWKTIQPTETDKGFSLSFPEARDISNGERDVLCLYAELIRIKFECGNKPAILIIDELFDYLDDANLVAAQYFISQTINEFESKHLEIFPIILTHLNPHYFKNFVFSKQKVTFLNKQATQFDQTSKKLVDFRNENAKDKQINDDISKYYLHYCPEDKDFSAMFASKGFRFSITNSHEFYQHVNTQLDMYKSGNRSFDPISVCCAIRIEIEKRIYELLPTQESKFKFIDTHKTPNKLDFAEDECSIDIPSAYRLLGIVYNDALHARFSNDISSPIYAKLNNETISHIIKNL